VGGSGGFKERMREF